MEIPYYDSGRVNDNFDMDSKDIKSIGSTTKNNENISIYLANISNEDASQLKSLNSIFEIRKDGKIRPYTNKHYNKKVKYLEKTSKTEFFN